MKKISEDGAALLEELRERPWRMVRRVKGEKKALVKQLEEQRRLEEQLRKQEEAEPPAP